MTKSSKRRLRNHQRSFHEGEKYACDICKKSFSHRETLKEHMSYHISAQNTGIIQNKCEICGKEMSSKSALEAHVLGVHEGKKVACYICKKDVVSEYLSKHIDSIHKRLRYPCDICQKTYSDKGYLTMHKAYVHEGKYNECKVCGKFVKNIWHHMSRSHNS